LTAERAAALPQLVVHHPRLIALHERITECLMATAEDGESQCLCLIGATGVGKTTAVRSYASLFPATELPRGRKQPVLYLETPHPITVKGMTSALLAELGDLSAFRGTQPLLNARLQHLLCACQVRLVILDDFHHLIDKQTNRVLRDVSEWLKVLIKNSGIVFLVVGIEGEVEQVLHANQQLSRLFVREWLKPFCWDAADKQGSEQFARLIAFVLNQLDLTVSDKMPTSIWLTLLHRATGGVMSNIMNLLRQVRRVQRRCGELGKPLTVDVLAIAYSERLEAHLALGNPFADFAANA
jgi:energy-coupling factor transporter ATP-binding protein EcfA2